MPGTVSLWQPCSQNYTEVSKLEYRVKKLDLDIKFLNTCQNNDLCPTFIQYKISLTRLQNSGAYRQSERLFIREDYFRNRKD